MGSLGNISQKKIATDAACMEKSTVLFTHQMRKSSPSATRHCPESNVYDMEFHCKYLIEYIY